MRGDRSRCSWDLHQASYRFKHDRQIVYFMRLVQLYRISCLIQVCRAMRVSPDRKLQSSNIAIALSLEIYAWHRTQPKVVLADSY